MDSAPAYRFRRNVYIAFIIVLFSNIWSCSPGLEGGDLGIIFIGQMGEAATSDLTGSSGDGSEYELKVMVTGLASVGGALVLENTGNFETLNIVATGTSSFATRLIAGDPYQVRILTQPTSPPHYCGIGSGGENGYGGGTLGAATVTVHVSCSVASKKVFVTSNNFKGDFNGSPGKAGADAACMADGNYPGGGTYKAMLVTDVGISTSLRRVACTTANCAGGAAEHSDWVFAAYTAYIRESDSTFVFYTNSNGIFPFSTCGQGGCIENSFDANYEQFWTGLSTDWRSHTYHCQNWTSNSVGDDGRYGETTEIDNDAISDYRIDCDNDLRLLCVEQ